MPVKEEHLTESDKEEVYMQLTNVCCISRDHIEQVEIPILKEVNIPLTVNGKEQFCFTCTPEYLEEMTIGYLITEGMIQSIEDIIFLDISETQICVEICSNETTDKYGNLHPPFFNRNAIFDNITLFFQSSYRHKVTRASHKAMLFFDNRKDFYTADDISRRSAIEKVVGMAVKNKENLLRSCLIFSGRVPADIAHKMIQAGIPMLIARSRPTCEAIRFAQEHDLVLCGNACEDTLMVYAGTNRLQI